MINSGVSMPYPGDEEPRHNFKSKISSPSKRTLNNKNYLADDAPPPAFDYTGGLGQDFSNKLRVSPVVKPSYGREAKPPLLQAEANPQYFMQNYRTEYKGAQGYHTTQQPARGGPMANRGSPGKNSKAGNGKPKNVRCKEKKDASMVPSLSDAQKQKIIANRYFSPAVDLQERKRTEGKLRPLIDVAYSGGKNTANYRNYRLSSPLMVSDKGFQVASQQIENVYREDYRRAQPLCRLGDKSVSYKTLQEMTAGLTEYLRNVKMPSVVAGRQLPTGSSWNESFDLSFDGKAIDRSDIFRMVDSFSVAFSDEEPEEDTNRGDPPSKNVLPAEMTSPAF